MKRIPSLTLVLAFTSALAFASGKPNASYPNDAPPAPTQNTPTQKPAWEVTLKQDAQATSNLEIENLCKGPHHFNVSKEDMAFLEYSFPGPVKVNGHQSYKLPVRFNANGMAPGLYKGNVEVLCLDCKAESTCTQDRENLPVVFTVVAAPEQPGSIRVGHDNVTPVPQTNNNPPQVPNQQEEYFLPSGTQNLNRANAAKLWASPFPPPGVPWCCCCCQQPIPLGPPQPPPTKGPPGKPAAVPINVTVNLGIGKFGPGKGIHVMYAVGTPISGAQYSAEAYIQWNASGGTGQLTVSLEVQRPGSTRWESLVSGMGPNDEHLFVTHAPGAYTFRATAKDSTGNSSFNTMTLTFPTI
jgi:hypothetical protein